MSQPAEVTGRAAWDEKKRTARLVTYEEKRAAREALLLQFVAEVERGLIILDGELKRGDFSAARETVAMMRLATVAVDGSIR